jgi:DNA topoisomerase-3
VKLNHIKIKYIGAAFTRFQTMRLQKAFPRNLAEKLISYGPCQFPTLGFVVERFLAIERFQPEPYWKLKVTHFQNDLTVEFRYST